MSGAEAHRSRITSCAWIAISAVIESLMKAWEALCFARLIIYIIYCIDI